MNWLLHKLRGDKIIWITVIMIALMSVLAIYSSTSALSHRMQEGDTEHYALRHFLLLGGGFVVMFIVHLLNYRLFARVVNLMLFITIPLLIYTISRGSEINEAARWVTIFGQSFQPSELAKITLMIFLAKLLTQRQEVIKDFTEGFLPALFWVTVICGLIAPADLSTAALMFVASMMVMFVAGVDVKYLGLLVVVAALGTSILFNTAKRSGTWQARMTDYKERIVNPEYEPNYQMTQAYIATSTGGLFGKGVGKSTQRNFLPHAYSDFVFAIIVEEYGMVGGTLLLCLYLLLLFRSVSIVTASKTFGALMAAGLAFLLVLQAMVNIGVTIGLLPITGLTLPMISMGGTSILFTAVSLGIILSVSRDVLENKKSGKAAAKAKRSQGFAIN
ncbi:MAG: FtsW/RodA/SpoVE family cell cycle protein [Bacteroidota bacterium]